MDFVSVHNGRIICDFDGNPNNFHYTDLDEIRKWFRQYKVRSVMCSSSVDFAHEYGVPENINVREDIIAKALDWKEKVVTAIQIVTWDYNEVTGYKSMRDVKEVGIENVTARLKNGGMNSTMRWIAEEIFEAAARGEQVTVEPVHEE